MSSSNVLWSCCVFFAGLRYIEGHMIGDHVHMMIRIPPKYAVSEVMGYVKGKSAIPRRSINFIIVSATLFFLHFFATAFAAEIELPQVTALFGIEVSETDYVPRKTPGDPKQAELWKAIKNDIYDFKSLMAGQIEKAGAGSGADVVDDIATILHRIKEKAEILYSLNPNGVAEKGILGSSIVNDFFYPNYYQFIASGQVADTTVLNRAIFLLKEAKKDGRFPKASHDLAVAYIFQRSYKEAFDEYKNVLEYFPDKRDYAEAVVAVFIFQMPGLDNVAKVKLAKEYSAVLSRWLSKTKSAIALDYLFLAKIYNVAGDVRKTTEYVNKGLKRFPDSGLLLEAQKCIKLAQ